MSREFLGKEFVIRAKKLHKEYTELHNGLGDNKSRWDRIYLISVEDDGILLSHAVYKEMVDLEIIEHHETINRNCEEYPYKLKGYADDLLFFTLTGEND